MSLRSQVEKLIKNDLTLSNKQLYKQCPGGNQCSIRVYAADFRKLYNKIPAAGKKHVTKKNSQSSLSHDGVPQSKGVKSPLSRKMVNEGLIEAAILDLYNKGQNTPNLVRCMVDYVLKIKGRQEEIDEDLDMEILKAIGVSIKDSD